MWIQLFSWTIWNSLFDVYNSIFDIWYSTPNSNLFSSCVESILKTGQKGDLPGLLKNESNLRGANLTVWNFTKLQSYCHCGVNTVLQERIPALIWTNKKKQKPNPAPQKCFLIFQGDKLKTTMMYHEITWRHRFLVSNCCTAKMVTKK